MNNSASTAEIDALSIDLLGRETATNEITNSAMANATNGETYSFDTETQNLTLCSDRIMESNVEHNSNQIVDSAAFTETRNQCDKPLNSSAKDYDNEISQSDFDSLQEKNLTNGKEDVEKNSLEFNTEATNEPAEDQFEMLLPNNTSDAADIECGAKPDSAIMTNGVERDKNATEDHIAPESDEDDGECESEQKSSLSHYKRPENRPLPPMAAPLDDGLSFDRISASQTYENFIKDAYSKALKQVERSRALIESQVVQEIGQLNRELEFIQSRPIRTFGRHNDTTHENERDSAESRSFRRVLHSVDSPPLSSDVTGDGASSSSSTNDADDPSCSNVEDRTTSSSFYPSCETNSLYGNRRYYSRFSRDPDYFDYDLRHSVDLYRKPNTLAANFTAPAAPTVWEHRLFKDKSRLQGDCTISPHLFNNDASKGGLKKTGALETSFISSALRTASYWEYRYQHMNGPLSK